jgi:hypothetical protein
MITASNIRTNWPIGAVLMVARKTGLIDDIDARLHLLKRHLPYHESDHVLNIALNILAGGHKLEHLELRRNDEVYLNCLVQGGGGPGLQRDLGLPPVGGLAGQHAGTAVFGQSEWQPPLARDGGKLP